MTSARAARSPWPAAPPWRARSASVSPPIMNTRTWWPPRTSTWTRAPISPTIRTTRPPGRRTAWPARLGRTSTRTWTPGPWRRCFSKGAHAAAYSGFEGADEAGTPLADWLRARGVDQVDVVGIATDYCVHATAADAARAGFATRVLLDLTAGVAPESTAKAIEDLRAAWRRPHRHRRRRLLAPDFRIGMNVTFYPIVRVERHVHVVRYSASMQGFCRFCSQCGRGSLRTCGASGRRWPSGGSCRCGHGSGRRSPAAAAGRRRYGATRRG